MQLVLGSQVVPGSRFISKHAPLEGSQAGTLHDPLGGGQVAGASSQMPNAHTAPVTHIPPGSHDVPFDLCSAAQPPVRASQMPTRARAVERRAILAATPEQTPFEQVPVVKQPVTPHMSPDVGW